MVGQPFDLFGEVVSIELLDRFDDARVEGTPSPL
jgi:hypothetical protein